nr:hypothetical protein [Pediococcus ethanolidurans]
MTQTKNSTMSGYQQLQPEERGMIQTLSRQNLLFVKLLESFTEALVRLAVSYIAARLNNVILTTYSSLTTMLMLVKLSMKSIVHTVIQKAY